MKLDEKTGFTDAELIAIFQARKKQEAGEASGEVHLRREEYEALDSRPAGDARRDVDFATAAGSGPGVTRTVGLNSFSSSPVCERCARWPGFSRILPPRGVEGDASNVVSRS